MKKISLGLITAGLVFAGATNVFAATLQSPAEIYAELKGITVEEAYEERAETKSNFCQLAEEAGILDEFKEEMIEIKKASIQQKVDDGKLTQEQADAMIEKIENGEIPCDAPGRMGKWRGNPDGENVFLGKGHGHGMRPGGCMGGRGF